jgi:hypothetical protein
MRIYRDWRILDQKTTSRAFRKRRENNSMSSASTTCNDAPSGAPKPKTQKSPSATTFWQRNSTSEAQYSLLQRASHMTPLNLEP